MTCAGCDRVIRADEARVRIEFVLPAASGRQTGPLLAHARCLRLEPTPAAVQRPRSAA